MTPARILLLILFLGAVIRLWGFDHHFTISSDPARDLLVARGAIETREIPWVGSFSSAGPFVFGPNWYWFLMLVTLVSGPVFLGPWLAMTAVSVLFILVTFKTGEAVGGIKTGLVTALIAAVSPAAIGLSAYLTQHAMVEICAGLAVLSLVFFSRKLKFRYAFLYGLGVGGATAFHYQGLYLLVFAPLVLVMVGLHPRRLVIVTLATVLGFFLPLLPLLAWDSSRGFQNTLHLIGYFRVGQYQFYVPNRWLTYLGIFWPEYLGKIFGGNVVLGWAGGFVIVASSLISVLKKRFNRTFIFLIAGFLLQVGMLRYFRGERYDGYLVYLHPTVIVILGWSLLQLVKLNNIGALMLISIFSFGSLVGSEKFIGWDNGINSINRMVERLKSQYPGEDFNIYGRTLTASNCAFTTSLVLDREGLNNDLGREIGLCLDTVERCDEPNMVEISQTEFQNDVCVLVDLSPSPKENLTKVKGWYPFSKAAVYDDVQNWWKHD